MRFSTRPFVLVERFFCNEWKLQSCCCSNNNNSNLRSVLRLKFKINEQSFNNFQTLKVNQRIAKSSFCTIIGDQNLIKGYSDDCLQKCVLTKNKTEGLRKRSLINMKSIYKKNRLEQLTIRSQSYNNKKLSLTLIKLIFNSYLVHYSDYFYSHDLNWSTGMQCHVIKT